MRKDQKKTSTSKKKLIENLSPYQIKIFDEQGLEKGYESFPSGIEKIRVSKKLIAQAVRVILANKRQGTVSTKTRSEVAGSTRKIYRQKGTGRARHGGIRAPIFVKGGVVGGPKPRDFNLSLNKKQKKLAFLAALKMKLKEDGIIGIIPNEQGILKTAFAKRIFQSLNLEKTSKVGLVSTRNNQKHCLGFRNLDSVELVESESLSFFDLIRFNKLILFGEETIKKLILRVNNYLEN